MSVVHEPANFHQACVVTTNVSINGPVKNGTEINYVQRKQNYKRFLQPYIYCIFRVKRFVNSCSIMSISMQCRWYFAENSFIFREKFSLKCEMRYVEICDWWLDLDRYIITCASVFMPIFFRASFSFVSTIPYFKGAQIYLFL